MNQDGIPHLELPPFLQVRKEDGPFLGKFVHLPEV
jgi:hypothetical protein